jgi:hypothetical protein
MIDPTNFRGEYDSAYDYVSPPIMPGIRQLAGVPEEHAMLRVNLDSVYDNYIPSHIPHFNDQRTVGPVAIPIRGMTRQGLNCGVEGFGGFSGRFLLRLFIFALIIILICYLIKNN